MSHGPSRWCRDSGDESHHWLGAVFLNPPRGFDFQITANLTDHDDAIGIVVGHEQLNRFKRRGPYDGITSDANRRGLPHTGLGHLIYGLISQCA